MRLHFDAGHVGRLLAHTLAAVERAPTLEQMCDGRLRLDGRHVALAGKPVEGWPTEADVDPARVPPGLWLVGSEGVSLTSNGRPEGGSTEGCHAARAMECGPEDDPEGWRDAQVAAFGTGDDTVAYLPRGSAEVLLAAGRDGLVCLDVRAGEVLVGQVQRTTWP